MSLYAHKNKIIALILVLVIVASWYVAWSTYSEHKEELILYFDEVTRTLALPYRIARLHMEEEVMDLPVPIAGVRVTDIADTWSNPRSGGRVHEGVDIFAPRGTPVFSVTRGYVYRTGISGRGGRYVFTIGPGGVRYYYAHLDRIANGITVGTEVTTDTVIGFVGNTGNASTTAPHLHLGVYERGPKNPYPLLVDRE